MPITISHGSGSLLLNRAHPQNQGLVSDWAIFARNSGGLIVPDNYGSNTLRLSARTSGNLTPIWIASRFPGFAALSFGSVDQAICQVWPNPIVSGFSSSFTFATWIYALSTNFAAGDNIIMASEVLSYTNYWASLSIHANTLTWALYDGTHNPLVSGTANDARVKGAYAHIVGVRDTKAGNISLYMNGALVGSTTDTTTSVPAYGAFGIGNQNYQQRPFHGLIDCPRVWNRALQAKEVFALYQAQLTSNSGLYVTASRFVFGTPPVSTASFASTLDGVTLSASSTFSTPAAFAATAGPAALSAAAVFGAAATFAATLGSASLAASCTFAAPATFAGTAGPASLSATSVVSTPATFAATLDDAVLVAACVNITTAAFAATLDDATLAASATFIDATPAPSPDPRRSAWSMTSPDPVRSSWALASITTGSLLLDDGGDYLLLDDDNPDQLGLGSVRPSPDARRSSWALASLTPGSLLLDEGGDYLLLDDDGPDQLSLGSVRPSPDARRSSWALRSVG
jgi:Concanavalin A-like lectin/glucanases superfamily